MSKQIVLNYTYSKAAKTVTLTDFTTVRLDRLMLITDVTLNTGMYNFIDSTLATATVSGNVITLSSVPAASADTDKLQIIYETGVSAPTADLTPVSAAWTGLGHASSNGIPITATATGVIAAPTAGNHLRIVRIHLSNAGATGTWIGLRNGAAGTQYYRTYLPQNGLLSINLNASGPLDLSSATRLDLVLSAAGSVEYQIDYLTVAD